MFLDGQSQRGIGSRVVDGDGGGWEWWGENGASVLEQQLKPAKILKNKILILTFRISLGNNNSGVSLSDAVLFAHDKSILFTCMFYIEDIIFCSVPRGKTQAD